MPEKLDQSRQEAPLIRNSNTEQWLGKLAIEGVNSENAVYMTEALDEYDRESRMVRALNLDQEIVKKLDLPKLPDGYAFTGGAARALFQEQCLGETGYVRDIDITTLGELSPDKNLAEQISEDCMGEDYRHGYGVTDGLFKNYFRKRDFTINEILATNKRLYFTERAAFALKHKLIDITEYETNEQFSNPKWKLSTKAVLLEQIFQEKYHQGKIVDSNYVCQPTNDFSVALQLNKALQVGPQIARRYIDSLVDYGMLGTDFKLMSIQDCIDQRFRNGVLHLDVLENDAGYVIGPKGSKIKETTARLNKRGCQLRMIKIHTYTADE